jgi:2-methylisocitrate lyase-like PEP mutase family enzyme
VRQAVRAYEKTGAAAMHIEDQTFPKRCGHLRGRDVIASDEMVQKIKAAVDARCDPDFVIISRGAAYRDAGADMLFIESPENEEEMQRICDAFCGSIPVLSNQIEGGRTPMPGAKRLQEMGFALALFSVGTAFAAAKGMQDYLATLAATGDTRDAIDGMVVFDEFNQIIGLDEHAEPEQRYAPRQQ